MIVLVCGGRCYTDQTFMYAELDTMHAILDFELLVHGDARGADRMAAHWAKARGIACRAYPADWATYGRRAGPIRNSQMLLEAKPAIVIAFEGGSGTADTVSKARKADVWIYQPRRLKWVTVF